MIAYIIQCFSHLEHIPALLDWVYAPRNRYVICVNPRSTDRFDLKGTLAGRPDVHVTNSVPVTWCGESLAVAMIDGIREALRVFDDWEYAINLSETCFPLKSQAELVDFLSAQRAAGITEFLHRFGPVAPRDLADLRVTHQFAEIPVVRPDTRIRVDRALNRYFADIHDSPIVDADFDLRPAIHALEACPGEVMCRPLYHAEYLARQAFLRQWPLYMGRMWYALSRRTCRWLAESETAAHVFEYMKSIYIPDECYLQTVLLGPGAPVAPERVSRDNLRFANGGPTVRGDNDLPELMASPRFFARKLALGSAPAVTAWLATVNRR